MEGLRKVSKTQSRTPLAAIPVSGMLLLVAAGLGVSTARSGEMSTNESAEVKVSGLGFLGNREMVRLLRNFQVSGEFPVTIDRTFVEDAALTLLSQASDEGYLHASLQARFETSDGRKEGFVWTNVLDVVLPREFSAKKARFKVNHGVRYYYKKIDFEGLSVFSESEAKSYFVSGDMLLKLRRNRVFNPSALNDSLSALRQAYARAGYQDTSVTTNRIMQDDSTGEVTVEVGIREGLPSVVRTVRVDMRRDGSNTLRTLKPNEPYSDFWQQMVAQRLRTEQFTNGHPDATATFSVLERDTNATSIQIDLEAQVVPGPLVRVHEVKLRGNKRTANTVMNHRIKLKPGEPLDRVEAEKSRQSLARLGAFESVGLSFEDLTNGEWNAIYDFQEVKPVSLSLLLGFGSYELLRGGIEFQNRNVLGRAHNLRLRARQSFKASQGDLLYTMPELLGQNLNFFLEGSGLRREEVSFTRQEFGSSIGVQKRIIPIQTDLSLRYGYEFLNASEVESSVTNLAGAQDARAASFVIEMTRDLRDHPLLPRKGLKLFGRMELAAGALGGNVDYQRLILGASYHLDLHGGRLIHLGVTHGVSFTLGGHEDDLPFNKRFFPGGENSVRGYQEGSASPLDENGDQLGAETYSLANLEFEQFLTKSWSVVTFLDAVGFAQNRADYPWDEGLYSAGGGIRWRTPIGPVRLEYGFNLHRREHDPIGTLHFSVGFPF